MSPSWVVAIQAGLLISVGVPIGLLVYLELRDLWGER